MLMNFTLYENKEITSFGTAIREPKLPCSGFETGGSRATETLEYGLHLCNKSGSVSTAFQ